LASIRVDTRNLTHTQFLVPGYRPMKIPYKSGSVCDSQGPPHVPTPEMGVTESLK